VPGENPIKFHLSYNLLFAEKENQQGKIPADFLIRRET
jgi:hypothetical protein